MNDRTQLPCLRERFLRRERRSVQAARRFTAETLTGWDLAGTDRADDVLLCVSELVTNALLHGVPPGRHSRLLLRYDGRVLGVEVHDSGPGVPRVVDDGDTGAEGGRGLLLVAALSDKWGVRERELGKAVWCEFLCDPLPAPAVRAARAS
ncbi:ATP-binding protein [Streptomyces sp. CdTB01]|uniref:ATP-binding protein n=1 Tax=Streptomyces sp. CdTB01 TaxID=1725411 RepID=UPI00073A8531|nr:ATP-binding protein [Streptomyces sp. CdTB01]ALV34308.1 ATPase [Streptomyces sp. CdTB01]NUP40444.1 ATP-binding protein [Streptomyces sp.]